MEEMSPTYKKEQIKAKFNPPHAGWKPGPHIFLSCQCPSGYKWCEVLVDEPLWLSDRLGCDWAKLAAKKFFLDICSGKPYYRIVDRKPV